MTAPTLDHTDLPLAESPTPDTGSDSHAPDGGHPTPESAGSQPVDAAGQPRDERGRWAPKGASGPAGEGSPVEGGDTPPEGDEPVDGAPEGLAATEMAPDAEEMPEGQPWSFSASGVQYTLGDTRHYPGLGLVVPEAQMDTLHRMLGRVIKSDEVLAQRQQMMDGARQEIAALQEFNQMAAQEWRAAAELVRQGRHEEALAALMEFAQELPTMEAKAEAEVLRRQLQEREAAAQPSPQVLYAEADQHADAAMGEMLMGMARAEWARGVTPQDLQQVAATVYRLRDRFIVRAPRDIPEEGIRAGEFVLDAEAAQALMEGQLRHAAQLRRAEAEARAVRQRAAQQVQRTRETIAAAPPAATGVASAPPPTPARPTFANAEEYRAWLEKTTRGA